MPLPPEPVLRAAIRWLERLPVSGYKRCRALFSTHPDFSDVTPTQYDAAYSWLREAGALNDGRRSTPIPQQVFEAVLLDLSWFPDAGELVRSPDELPEDAFRAAKILGLDSTQAFQHLHAFWGKVDTERRIRIGSAGEAALVKLLEDSVAAHVEHVSQHSDGYGYDIKVQNGAYQLHIEVKTTLRRHSLTVFLSRHEYETMVHDSAWQLVVVRLSGDLKAEAVCSVRGEWIRQHVPQDRTVSGRWESCRLKIPSAEATSGIERLAPLLAERRSPMVDGSAGW
ncbi:DUF3883 domain-containing protein [Streptosporangium sp. NPDC020072]|uniref:protein NO VEIN domain-containing protein n=1 Tax=Streptosporangium sp. NPDC020072 TaxID=3154788 RepID=UPI00341D58D2